MKTTSSSSDPAWAGLSCILVAQNDQGNVAPAVAALTRALAGQCGTQIGDYEIILVDDGSSDLTGAEALRLQETDRRVRVMRHTEPQGFGAAFHSGFIVARYPLVFLSTADNRFDYGQIVAFLSYAQEYDVVVGFRPDRQDPLLRKAASAVWNFLVTLLFGWRLRDIDCTFKLFHREALTQVDPVRLRSRGAIIHTEFLTLFKRERLRILEAPVTHFPGSRDIASGITPRVVLRALWKILGLRARLTAQTILGYLGFITGMLSRTSRPMEVIVYRRSKMLMNAREVVCRLCGASGDFVRKTDLKTSEDLVHLGDYSVFYCTVCRNAFTYPLPEESKGILLPDVPFQQLSPFQRKLMDWFIHIRVQRVIKAARSLPPRRVLDVDGGNCALANALAKRGLSVTVVDPNPANQVYADAVSGVSFITAPFSDDLIRTGTLEEGRFDVVTMWHSLEHMPNPVLALDVVQRLLRPEGCLYVCVPNLNSFQADLGRNYWAYLDVPHHLTHFTLDGLISLLRQSGYAQINIHWFSPEYEVLGFYQTLLNIISRSHNYYYNRSQKGKAIEANLRFPMWTRIVTALGFLLVPLALILSIAADVTGKSACVEVHCHRSDTVLRPADTTNRDVDA